MDIDHGSQLFGTEHQTGQSGVVDHHALFFVYQKAFKTGNTLLHCFLHLVKYFSAV